MAEASLPELAALPWRQRASPRTLSGRARLWTAWTWLLSTQFALGGVVVLALSPLLAPLALIVWAHGWAIAELYAARGAKVLKPRSRAEAGGEPLAQGLLGDLLDHEARELQRRTGVALERADLGAWLIGEAGALLVVPGARRVHCFCVRTTDPALPPSDRIAHLLLALRTDERGFATVANQAFAGAPWRVRRRLPAAMRPALRAAVDAAKGWPKAPPRWGSASSPSK